MKHLLDQAQLDRFKAAMKRVGGLACSERPATSSGDAVPMFLVTMLPWFIPIIVLDRISEGDRPLGLILVHLVILLVFSNRQGLVRHFQNGEFSDFLAFAPVATDFWVRRALKSYWRGFAMLALELGVGLATFPLLFPKLLSFNGVLVLWVTDLVVIFALAWLDEILNHYFQVLLFMIRIGACVALGERLFFGPSWTTFATFMVDYTPFCWPARLVQSSGQGLWPTVIFLTLLGISGWIAYRRRLATAVATPPFDAVVEWRKPMDKVPEPTTTEKTQLLREKLKAPEELPAACGLGERWMFRGLSLSQKQLLYWFQWRISSSRMPLWKIFFWSALAVPLVVFFESSQLVTALTWVWAILMLVVSCCWFCLWGFPCAGWFVERVRIAPRESASWLAVAPTSIEDLWAIQRRRMVMRLAAVVPVVLFQGIVLCWINAWDSAVSQTVAMKEFGRIVAHLSWCKIPAFLMLYHLAMQRAVFAVTVAAKVPPTFFLKLAHFCIRCGYAVGLVAVFAWVYLVVEDPLDYLTSLAGLACVWAVSVVAGRLVLRFVLRSRGDWVVNS